MLKNNIINQQIKFLNAKVDHSMTVNNSNNNEKSQNDILNKQKPSQSPVKLNGKISAELVWKAVFLFITIVSAILINKIYIYQTSSQFQSIRKGNIFELFIFGIPFGVIFIYLEHYAHKKLDDKCQKYYLSYQRYKTEQSRKKRSYNLVKWIHSIIYYTLSSASAYIILKNTSFLPTWLGGNGQCTNLLPYLNNFDEANIYMKVFYIIQFGKHLGRFLNHMFIRSEGAFYEYALHHGLSTFLIFFSYLMNMWLIGIFVLFIHDLSDFVLIVGRGYRDYKYYNKIVIKLIYYVGGFIWVACRICLLSYCCVYSSFSSAYYFVLQKQQFSQAIYNTMLIPGIFMGFMLFSLLILQIFWTYFVVLAFTEVTVTQKVSKYTYEADNSQPQNSEQPSKETKQNSENK